MPETLHNGNGFGSFIGSLDALRTDPACSHIRKGIIDEVIVRKARTSIQALSLTRNSLEETFDVLGEEYLRQVDILTHAYYQTQELMFDKKRSKGCKSECPLAAVEGIPILQKYFDNCRQQIDDFAGQDNTEEKERFLHTLGDIVDAGQAALQETTTVLIRAEKLLTSYDSVDTLLDEEIAEMRRI